MPITRTLIELITSRLTAVPAIYYGSVDVLAVDASVLLEDAMSTLIAVLQKPDTPDPYLWSTWGALEQTVLADMVFLGLLDRISLLANGTRATSLIGSAGAAFGTPQRFLTKGKAGDVEAQWDVQSPTALNSASTANFNVAQLLAKVFENTKNRLIYNGSLIGAPLAGYVGFASLDRVRVLPYLLP